MKKLFIILLWIIGGSPLMCQTWQLEWQNCFGGSDEDYASDIASCGNGYLLAGRTESNDGDITNSHGGREGWVVRIDNTGNLQWQRPFGGSSDDFWIRIIPAPNNQYYLLGISNSSNGDIDYDPYPLSPDYWIVKTDSSGNILWSKILGGTGGEWLTNGVVTTDGGIVAIGYTNSDDGDISNYYGAYDMWMVKLNAQGEKQWDFTLGNEYYDYAWAIIQTSDGGFLVGGTSKFTQGGNLSCNLHGGAEAVVVKLDSLRNIEWSQCYGGSLDDITNRLIETNDGYVFAGTIWSGDGDVTSYHGGGDIWVVKIDFDGSIVWQKCLGGTGYETPTNICVESDGSYVVFGITQSNNGDVSGNHNIDPTIYDIWMVRLSSGGEFVSQQCIGGIGDEQLEFGVVQKGDGDYVIAGQMNWGPTYDVSCTHQSVPLESDYWVFEIKDTAVGLSELPAGNGKLEVRPNPADDRVVLSYTLPAAKEGALLTLTDVQGRRIKAVELHEMQGEEVFDTHNLRPGIYFYTLTCNGLSRSGKLVVE
ncbi:MAG: T9SS type A sorting domain-containing protein [Bacteroidales bacterium]|nr:T9SS type A sorting domain-containing protein [Bacteroidales bacterium]MDD3666748.1 T9SS type A sorting domain-containing protein [Bacteroidales bacterium]